MSVITPGFSVTATLDLAIKVMYRPTEITGIAISKIGMKHADHLLAVQISFPHFISY